MSYILTLTATLYKLYPHISVYGLTYHLTRFKPLRWLIYVNNVSLCFPRSRFSATYPVSATFSSSSLRIKLQRNVICPRMMSCRFPFSTPALQNTSHVLTLSVQGIINIIYINMCSAASKFFMVDIYIYMFQHVNSEEQQSCRIGRYAL